MLGAFLVALIINTPPYTFQRCYQTFNQESQELVRFVIHSMWVNIYLIIIVITIILVFRELRKLRVSSVGDQPAADEVVTRATYLILATAAGFVSCLIPVLGAEVHLVVDPDAPINHNYNMSAELCLTATPFSTLWFVLWWTKPIRERLDIFAAVVISLHNKFLWHQWYEIDGH